MKTIRLPKWLRCWLDPDRTVRPAEITSKEGELTITGEAFTASGGDLRMWAETSTDIDGNKLNIEVPIGSLVGDVVDHRLPVWQYGLSGGPRLTITIKKAES